MKINNELLSRLKEVRSLFYIEPSEAELKAKFHRLNIQESIYPITDYEAVIFKSKIYRRKAN
jgi:hypothetical protein